jgi:hypothetical protein
MNFTLNWRQWVCIFRKKKEGNLNDSDFEKKCSTKNMR